LEKKFNKREDVSKMKKKDIILWSVFSFWSIVLFYGSLTNEILTLGLKDKIYFYLFPYFILLLYYAN